MQNKIQNSGISVREIQESIIINNMYSPTTQFSKRNAFSEFNQQDEESGDRQQNIKKIELSNYEAFLWKNTQKQANFLSSFQLINIPKIVSGEVTLQKLNQLNFPVLSYKVNELVDFSVKILCQNQYCRQKFEKENIIALILQIAKNYNIVSYHNFSHAFSLMLLNYQCLERQSYLKNSYSAEQNLYILLAGLSHDLNHKGTNNAFEIKKHSELAQISNNQAVLEHMHIRTLWKIFSEKEQFNILSKSKSPQKAKKFITRLILNTDVSRHFKNVEVLRKMRIQPTFDIRSDEQTRYFIMQQLFHACDIGNPCVEYESYMNWAALLSHQFNEQANLERNQGLQVTQMFVYKNLSSLHKDQVWFVGNLVYPLWKEMHTICHGFAPMIANIETNVKRLEEENKKWT